MDIFQFIITNIFMLSVGAVLYMAVRTLPRIEDEPAIEKRGAFERWLTSEVPEKIDAALNGFLFKSLKKTRVLLLRFDNTLGEHLKKIKPDGNGSGKSRLDFSAMSGSVAQQADLPAAAGEKNGEAVAKESDLDNNQ